MSTAPGTTARLEYLALVLLGACAVMFLIFSRSYNPTAAFFPRWVAITSLLSLAAIVVQLLKGRNSSGASVGQAVEPAFETVSRTAAFGAQGGYIVLIYLFGLFAATLLFLTIAPIQMRYNRLRVVLIQSVILTVVIVGSFLWIFKMELPRGVIWDMW
jgi:hypothetical protein